jgi:hypothetical protein
VNFASNIQRFNSVLTKLNGLTDINEVFAIVNNMQVNMNKLEVVGETVDEALDNVNEEEIQDVVAPF